MIKKLMFVAALISVLFVSCKKENETTSACESGTIKGIFDGANWEMASLTNASIFMGNDPSTGYNGYRLDILAKGKDGSTLQIIVNEFENGVSDDCMNTQKTWSTLFYENYIDPVTSAAEIAIFTITDKTGKGSSTLLEELPGSFKITSCDPKNHILSGEFNFSISDDDFNEIKFLNGKFEDICFKAL